MGAEGERAAEEYLVGLGAKVLARNFSCPQGEVDLIVEMDGQLVFVEVKSRGGFRFGRGAEAVDVNKRRHITRTAMWYLRQRHQLDERVRFDVIEVSGEGIKHLRAAFFANMR